MNWMTEDVHFTQARAKTPKDMMATAFTPNVVGQSGGRPAFSLLQMYRCMVLRLVQLKSHVIQSWKRQWLSWSNWPQPQHRNMELRNADRFKSALTAALQLASGNQAIGDEFRASSLALRLDVMLKRTNYHSNYQTRFLIRIRVSYTQHTIYVIQLDLISFSAECLAL